MTLMGDIKKNIREKLGEIPKIWGEACFFVLVDPRDLPVKFGQNWISDRLDIVVVFIVVDVFSYVVVVVVDPSLVKIGPVIAEILVFVV